MAIRKGSSGRLYYNVQGSGLGTPEAPTLPLPLFANFRANSIGNLAEVRAAGSRRPVELEEGMHGVEWGVDYVKVQGTAAAKAFYDLAQDDAGDPALLTFFTLGYGDDREAWQVQDCKMGTLSFAWDAGETSWLTGSSAGFGRMPLAGQSYPAQTYIDTPGFAYHEAQHSHYEMTGGNCTFEQNVEMRPVILGPAGTRTQREWDYLPEGDQAISGDYTLTSTSGQDFNAATITSSNQVLHFLNKAAPADTISLEFAGLAPTNEELTIPASDGDIEFALPWLATDFVFELEYP